jgi:hypothetical protein
VLPCVRWRAGIVALVAVAALRATVALAAGSTRFPVCESARYLLPAGQPLVPGSTTALDAVVLNREGAAIASGCPVRSARLKGRKRGTRVKVIWPPGTCTGLRGRVRLTATIDPTCGSMQGKFVAKKLRRTFRAARSTCGDGMVDRGGLEVCEPPAAGCDPTCGAGAALPGPADAPLVDVVRAFHTPQDVPEDEILERARGDHGRQGTGRRRRGPVR